MVIGPSRPILPIRPVLDIFLARTATILRSVNRSQLLVEFARVRPSGLNTEGIRLREAIRRDGTPVLQIMIDGSILLLCAAFEQFITDSIIAFCTDLPTIVPNYHLLPEGIRKSNERYTGQALAYGSRFPGFTRQQLIQNLHDCNSGHVPYLINGEAIASTERNLTSSELTNIMTRLSLREYWKQVSLTAQMKAWSGTRWKQTMTKVTTRLNELIELRNKIAHGAGGTTIGASTAIDYINFTRALSKAHTKILTTFINNL